MERKNLNQVSIQVRNSYNRIARSSASVGLEEAIDLLKDFVGFNPEVAPARERLRELEKRYFLSQSAVSKIMAKVVSAFKLPLIRAKMLKDPVTAMAMCEACLAKNLDNPLILNTLADAAYAAGAPFIASEALMIAHEFHPGNEPAARKLIAALQQSGQAREALRILKELASRHPTDLALQSELRSAMALASLERGQEASGEIEAKAAAKKKGQPEAGGDKSAQALQQLIDGTIHDADQARMLIEKFTEELQKQDSIDMRRKLSEAYMIAEEYDKAVAEMKRVAEMIGALDPTLDKSIERATLKMLDQKIDKLKAAPADENSAAEIAKLQAERHAYQVERAEDRVNLYPNDALLHFDLAELYFGDERYDDALREYQQAMRSPQKRVACLLRLGRCFSMKKQYDIAVEQFETAMKDMMRGSELRVETLYYLGNTYEESGNMEKAVECYKDIYQSQANYRDVAQRIDAYYNSRKQQ